MHYLAALVISCLAALSRASVSPYGDFLADLQYLYNLKQLQDDVIQYYPDDDSYSGDKLAGDWGAYPDVIDQVAPKDTRDYGEAALRDQEYMKQLPLSGYQFISGGTGRQEDPSEVKTDKVLPAYCTPPNPCPQGYTGDDCVKDFENSPENNRRLLGEQDCPCDAEHMFSCPPGKKTIDPKSGFVNEGIGSDLDLEALDNIDLGENPYLSTSRKRQKMVKKSYPGRLGSEDLSPLLAETLDEINPFLYGQQPKSVVSKKMAPRHDM